jgi:hypothetical protein
MIGIALEGRIVSLFDRQRLRLSVFGTMMHDFACVAAALLVASGTQSQHGMTAVSRPAADMRDETAFFLAVVLAATANSMGLRHDY